MSSLKSAPSSLLAKKWLWLFLIGVSFVILEAKTRRAEVSTNFWKPVRDRNGKVHYTNQFPQRKTAEVTKSAACPRNFENLGDSCYYFAPFKAKTYNHAWDECKKLARHSRLASLETEAEHDRIINYLFAKKWLKRNWWLSAQDAGKEGEWRWMPESKPMKFANWCPKEPSGGEKENCLHLKQPSGCFNDVSCSYEHSENPGYAICEVTNATLHC